MTFSSVFLVEFFRVWVVPETEGFDVAEASGIPLVVEDWIGDLEVIFVVNGVVFVVIVVVEVVVVVGITTSPSTIHSDVNVISSIAK